MMKENFKNLKDIKSVEVVINRHLYLICAFVTVVVMSLTVIEFFSRGRFPSLKMNLFYMGVLGIYSFHKELIRWLGQRRVERQGEYFVYAWILLTTFLYVINFFSKDYFAYSAQGYPLPVLREASLITLEVLGIFVFTRILKILKNILIK